MAEYIEKQAALDIVNGWRDQLIPTYGENDEHVKCLETVAEHLESLHAADVRPVVRGRWIWEENDWQYRCSVCRMTFDYDKTYELFDHGYASYCPNCGSYNGADMREKT